AVKLHAEDFVEPAGESDGQGAAIVGVQQAYVQGVEVLQVPAPEKEIVGIGRLRAVRELVPPVDDAGVEGKVVLNPALLGLAVKGALRFDHGGGDAQKCRLDRLCRPPRVGPNIAKLL